MHPVTRLLGLMCLALLLLCGSALAERVQADGRSYEVTCFETLPAELSACLDSLIFTPEEVTAGILALDLGSNAAEGRVYARHALLAVQHGENQLLVSCERLYSAEGYPAAERDPDAVWTSQPIARDFLADLSAWQLNYGPWDALDDGGPWFILEKDDTQWYLHAGIDGGYLGGYAQSTAEDLFLLDLRRSGRMTAITRPAEGTEIRRAYTCRWLNATTEISLDTLPATVEGAAAWAEAHPLPVDTAWRVIGSMNLRESPTGRSASLAMYNYPVLARWLGETDGLVEPWVRVQVGELTGWVSASYVHGLHQSLYLPRGNGLPLLLTTADTTLFAAADGETLTTLPAGTAMHRLTQWRNGWAQVCIPAGDIGYTMDVDGQYGWIRQDEALREAFSWLQAAFLGL